MIYTTGVLQQTGFKPMMASPLDNRDVVSTRNDLISNNVWQVSNNGTTVDLRYTGMVVAVQTGLQGLYWLDSLANKDRLWATHKIGWRRLIFEGETSSGGVNGDFVVNQDELNAKITLNDSIWLVSNDNSITYIVNDIIKEISLKVNPDVLPMINSYKKDIITNIWNYSNINEAEEEEQQHSTSVPLLPTIPKNTPYIALHSTIGLTNDVQKIQSWRLVEGNGISFELFKNNFIKISSTNDANYTLPPATTTTLGAIIVGVGLNVTTGNGPTAGTLSVPLATTTTRGAIIVGTGLQMDSHGKLNVTQNSNLSMSLGTPLLSTNPSGDIISTHPIQLKNGSVILSSVNLKSSPNIKISQSGNTLTLSHQEDNGGGLATKSKIELKHSTPQSTVISLVDTGTEEVVSAYLFEAGEGLRFEYDSKPNNYDKIPGLRIPSIKIRLVDENIVYHTITTEIETGVNISPSGTISVDDGEDKTFSINALPGYLISRIYIDGEDFDELNGQSSGIYTFNNVTEDHTIHVTSMLSKFQIAVDTGSNGQVIPGNQVVNAGANINFIFTANSGYEIDQVLVDDDNQPSSVISGNYTFVNVQQNHTLKVTFKPIRHIIQASTGENGNISPSGNVIVNQGTNQTFTVTPNVGYMIDQVLIDTALTSIPINQNTGIGSYTFHNVQGPHTISILFKLKTYKVNPYVNGQGTVTPNTSQNVLHGGNIQFTFEPESGHRLSDVVVNGASNSVPPNQLTAYNFMVNNVTQDTTVEGIFVTHSEINPKVGATLNDPLEFEEVIPDVNDWYEFILPIIPTDGCKEYGFRVKSPNTPGSTEIFDVGGWQTYEFTLNNGWDTAIREVNGENYTLYLYDNKDLITGDCIGIASPSRYRINLT